MGLESKGRTFRDRFLIADVKMKADFPTERWFWFDPPFHPGQSVLLHRQPDNIWRIDFQLGWDADPVVERQPERVIPRVKALLGEQIEFELEWCSVYTFSCLRMETFRRGRVLFAGDSAHGVSPFGARGANSGVQDAENLGPEHGCHRRRRLLRGVRRAGNTRHGAAGGREGSHRHRQTDQIRHPLALPRRSRAGRIGLPGPEEQRTPKQQQLYERVSGKMTSPSAFGFAAHSYDAVMLLALAIKQANSTEGPKIREALENLQTPYDGMMKDYNKPFSKTEHEALRIKDYKWTHWQEGKLLPYTDQVVQSLTDADYKK